MRLTLADAQPDLAPDEIALMGAALAAFDECNVLAPVREHIQRANKSTGPMARAFWLACAHHAATTITLRVVTRVLATPEDELERLEAIGLGPLDHHLAARLAERLLRESVITEAHVAVFSHQPTGVAR